MAGLFGMFNYAKEGPGVAKDAPKKRTFFDFMEIYGRKFWKLTVAGLLWALVSIPILTRGLADAGLTFITRNYSRQKHAFLKEDFFGAIKKNAKCGIKVGIINTFVTGLCFYNMLLLIPKMIPGLYLLAGLSVDQLPPPQDLTALEMVILAITLMVYVTFTWMKYYIPFLMITFKLRTRQLYKNACLFAGSNMKVNLGISAILIALYGLLAMVLYLFPNPITVAIVIMLCITIVPAFRSFLIQYSIFPAIKRLIIDPYYEKNPDADKQARRDLGLDVEEDAPVKSAAKTEDAANAASPAPVQEEKEEPIFTDTLPKQEADVPKRVLPKQYNEKELRRFNRQVQKRVTDDDDDTI